MNLLNPKLPRSPPSHAHPQYVSVHVRCLRFRWMGGRGSHDLNDEGTKDEVQRPEMPPSRSQVRWVPRPLVINITVLVTDKGMKRFIKS